MIGKQYTLITVVCLVLMLVQCRKNDIKPSELIIPEGELVEFSLSASSGDEKGNIEGMSIKWSAGDRIFVVDMDASGSGLLGSLSAETGGSITTKFKGTIVMPVLGHRCMFYYVGSNAFTPILSSENKYEYEYSVATQNGSLNGDNGLANKLLLMRSIDPVTITEGMLVSCSFGSNSVMFKSMIAISRLNLQINASSMSSGTVTLAGSYSKAKLNVKTGDLTPVKGNITLNNASSNYYLAIIPTNQTATVNQALKLYTSTGERLRVSVPVAANMIYNKDTPKALSMVANPGALVGDFSVGNGVVVEFSKGNLQFQASTRTWQFASSQSEYLGSSNTGISSTYSGWIDLFGWGTGNVNATTSTPWCSTMTSSNYGPSTGNLNSGSAATTTAYDWGINAISNGGNASGRWFTPTIDQWVYLINVNNSTSNYRQDTYRFAKAMVNGVKGLIIFPDCYETPLPTQGMATVNDDRQSYPTESIPAATWTAMEAKGVVFLSTAGYRYNTNLGGQGSRGLYSSGSYHPSYANHAYYVNIQNDYVSPQTSHDRYYGISVRLVQDSPYIVSTGLQASGVW